MSHLDKVTAWAQGFAPQAQVLFEDKKLGKIWQSVDGHLYGTVEEVYFLRQVLPKSRSSLEEMLRLQNTLTANGQGKILAEKARLAKVLPGNAGIYQITLKAGYEVDLEDENGED